MKTLIDRVARVPGFCFLLGTLSLLHAQVPESNQDPLAGLPVVTLDECVKAALESGPDAALAKLNLDAASAILTQSRAKQGLTLGESAGYSHSGTSSSNAVSQSSASAAAAAGNGAVLGENLKGAFLLSGPDSNLGLSTVQSFPRNATDRVTSFGLTGSQTVWDGLPGGVAGANLQLAEAAYRVAAINEEAALKTAVFQMEQAYYTALGDQKTLAVRLATQAMAQANLLQEQSLFQAGRATELDILQMKVTLRQAQLDWNKAVAQLTSDRKSLSVALGWSLDKAYQLSEGSFPTPLASDTASGVKLAMEHRPELRTLAENWRSAQTSLLVQKAGSSPVVTVTGSLGVGQDWSTSTGTENFAVGADIALPPVYDGGLNSAQVRGANGQIEVIELQQAQTRQTIAVAVEKDVFAVQDAKDRLDLAQTSLEAAQGQYDLQKSKLVLGLALTTDVLTAFTNLVSARLGLEQAKSVLVLAILQLNNDLGL